MFSSRAQLKTGPAGLMCSSDAQSPGGLSTSRKQSSQFSEADRAPGVLVYVAAKRSCLSSQIDQRRGCQQPEIRAFWDQRWRFSAIPKAGAKLISFEPLDSPARFAPLPILSSHPSSFPLALSWPTQFLPWTHRPSIWLITLFANDWLAGDCCAGVTFGSSSFRTRLPANKRPPSCLPFSRTHPTIPSIRRAPWPPLLRLARGRTLLPGQRAMRCIRFTPEPHPLVLYFAPILQNGALQQRRAAPNSCA